MKKREILEYISNDFANDKQIDFIYKLLCLPQFCSKLDLLKLAGINPDQKNFDTAYPIGLYDAIKPIYKGIDKANLIYDYSDNKFGELVNVNDLLTANILNLKK